MIAARHDRLFTWCNNAFMLLMTVAVLYPFINILAISLNEGQDAVRGGIYLWPRVFSLNAYEIVFKKTGVLGAAGMSVARTIVGIVTGLLATALLGYLLSKKDLLFRRGFILFFVVPMYFSGGIIPTYILIRQLHLIDSFFVYIIPPLIGLWNVMIMRTFFEDMPAELLDSARIDGCGEMRIFARIVMPLSKPVLACVALFIGVSQWNSWYDTYLYTSSGWLVTLQGILVKVLWERQSRVLVDAATLSQKAQSEHMPRATPETVQMAIIVITTVPIVLIYPFVQKYFVKGVMVGAIKG
jgi:putative aldouronate transport system permease protein